jgi:hypothetical protein
MKWPVYILLMATLAYISETVRLPFQLSVQQETPDCCHKDTSHDKKGGCCNPTANCTNCPLCYTAELTVTYASKEQFTCIIQHYPECQEQPLTDYTASTWKPPNA